MYVCVYMETRKVVVIKWCTTSEVLDQFIIIMYVPDIAHYLVIVWNVTLDFVWTTEVFFISF